jgi:mannose-6-phosphate isomerase-like protein (cupin superfamily)
MIPTIKDYPKDKTHYEHFADDAYYIFLQKHSFFLDVPHYHDSIEILCVTKGQTTVHLNGATHELSEGEIFVCNSQMVHFYENYEDDKLALIAVLSAKYLRTFREVYKNVNFPSVLRDKTANAQIYAILDEWFNLEKRNVLVDSAYANLFLNKIVELYDVVPANQEDENNVLAINFINFVNENYNKEITLESAAKHFGYSKEYFSKKFKQTVDKNFLAFVN